MQPLDYSTKISEIYRNSVELIEKMYNKSINKSRLDFIETAVQGIIVSRSVQFIEIADKMTGDADEMSKVRRIQRFMSDYDLDYEWLLCFLLLLLPKKGKVTLSLDRTEWEFGSQNHNVLVLSIYTHGVGFPIWFECLDNNGGNSCSDDRIYVILSCMKYLGKDRIKAIIGDCEFIGDEWVGFLMDEGIPFYLDVRSNQYFIHENKKHKISTYMTGRHKKALDNIYIFGYWLSIAMKRQTQPKEGKKGKKGKRKDILAIVTNMDAGRALTNYKNRWSIEVLFENLKTRGFHLEDTHLTDPVRLRKLFALCAIGFALCFLVGLALNKIKPIAIKNHGFKENSFFRYGLDFIRKISKNIRKRTNFKRIKQNIQIVINQIIQIISDNFLHLQKIVT
jgi:Transposase DDE domain